MKLADLAKLEEKWSERGLVVVGVHRYPLLSLFNGCRHKGTRRSFLFAVPSLNTNGRMTMCDMLSKGLVAKQHICIKILNQQNPLRYRIRHPVCNDKGASLWRGLGVTCWPTQLLLSPTGSPLHVVMGEGHAGWMEELVEVVVEYYGERGSLTGRCPPFEEGEIEGSLLCYPGKVAAGLDKLLVADSGHHRLLVIEPSSGEVEKVIGTGQPGVQDGPLAKAQFRAPQGIAVVDGLIYVCDTENHLLRMVDLVKGTVETVAGTGAQGFDRVGGKQGKEQAISSPWDVCHVHGVDGGSGLLVAMAGIHQLWLFCITDLVWWKNLKFSSGTMVSVAGSGNEENRNNSYPTKAAFAQPSGVAATAEWVYLADSESSTIRRISRCE